MNETSLLVGGVGLTVLLAVVASLVAVIVVIRLVRQRYIRSDEGVVTTGHVVDHERIAYGTAPDVGFTLVPVYRFVDRHGVERTARDQFGDNGRIPAGSVIAIRYRPEDPSRVRRMEHLHSTGRSFVG